MEACCIIPPKELWEPIQLIRSKYDPGYKRWMSHVNLMFPFVPSSQFPVIYQQLRRAMENMESFDMTLSEFCHFEHKNKCVMWLKPKTPSGNEIENLLQAMLSVIPHCDDQLNKNGAKKFCPHLTVGQFTKSEIDKKEEEFQANWKDVTWKVNEIYMISKANQNSSFAIDYKIPLGGSTKHKNT
jgi:2'-5' RNA ligase